MKSRLLITGAAGEMGTLLRSRLANPERVLRLLDIRPVADPVPDEEVIIGSITDPVALAEACVGADAVLHLAGVSDEAPWCEILSVNIDGAHTVLETARQAGIRRVILASSSHAAGFYRRSEAPVLASAPPRPDSYYGFSKAAVEALGSLYAHRFEMDIACLRIGTCRMRPPNMRALATWLSPDDAAALVEACLKAPQFGHRIVWGISANTRRWLSLSEGASLGYFPSDDAEAFAAEIDIAAPDLEDEWLGGVFCVKPLGKREE